MGKLVMAIVIALGIAVFGCKTVTEDTRPLVPDPPSYKLKTSFQKEEEAKKKEEEHKKQHHQQCTQH